MDSDKPFMSKRRKLLQAGLATFVTKSPLQDANVFLPRVTPPEFTTWLPVLPATVNGPGDVLMNNSTIAALFQKYLCCPMVW